MTPPDAAGFPSVDELLPQSGPMLLVGPVLAHDERGTRCAVDPAASALFQREPDRVPVWVALEYMAQCAGVHGGLVARGRSEAPQPAVFVGSRRLAFACDDLSTADALEVEARPAGASAGAVAFDCRVFRAGDAEPLASGRLLVARLAPEATGAGRVTL